MLNKLHGELLISYYRDQIKKYPNGYFGTCRGRDVMYITYDPLRPQINPRNKRTICMDSKEGKIYKPLIEEAKRIELKIAELMTEWNLTYKGTPGNIKRPLRKIRGSLMTGEMFKCCKPNLRTDNKETRIQYKGQYLRSKNELNAFQLLESMGYEVKAEININLGLFCEFDPDLTFYIPETDSVVCLEADGAMDKDAYYDKSEYRRKKYLKCGFSEIRDVIFFRMYEGNSIDIQRMKALINASILANMENLMLDDSDDGIAGV